MNITTPKPDILERIFRPRQHSQLDYVIIIFYCLIFILGVTGNTLVLLYFRLENKKLKHIQILLFYLACFDLIASFVSPLFFVYLHATHFHSWHFGLFGCKVIPLVLKISITMSIGIIMFINIDRCMAIYLPFHEEIQHIGKIIFTMTIVSVLLETPYLTFSTVIKGHACTVRKVMQPEYAYPTVTILFLKDICYFFVFLISFIVYNTQLRTKSHTLSDILQRTRRLKEDRTVLKLLIALATTFTILVFPKDMLTITYTISWLHGDGIPKSSFLVNINSLLTLTQTSNSFVNIFIYAKIHKRFRKKLTKKVSVVLPYFSKASADSKSDRKQAECIEMLDKADNNKTAV